MLDNSDIANRLNLALLEIVKRGDLKKANANQLSNALGITSAAVYALLNGSSMPRAEVLYVLNNKFKINLNWLISGKGSIFIDGSGGSIETLISEINTLLQKFKH